MFNDVKNLSWSVAWTQIIFCAGYESMNIVHTLWYVHGWRLGDCISLYVLYLVLKGHWVIKYLYPFKTCFNIYQSVSKMPFSLGLICLHRKILIIFLHHFIFSIYFFGNTFCDFFFSDLQISSLAILYLLNLNAFLSLAKQILSF